MFTQSGVTTAVHQQPAASTDASEQSPLLEPGNDMPMNDNSTQEQQDDFMMNLGEFVEEGKEPRAKVHFVML